MAKQLTGRRHPDRAEAQIDWDDIKPGDYWRELDGQGEPVVSNEPGNLTHGVYWVAVPMSETGFALARLTRHTVREEADGTISVRAGDGSSNSILVQRGANGPSWHGYIEHGVWNEL